MDEEISNTKESCYQTFKILISKWELPEKEGKTAR